jgi:O-antigen biosynthesis protein
VTISIVTSWFQHPELRSGYDAAVMGAEVIVIDTSDMRPFSFAAACNQGLAKATCDVVMFLNNDITAAPGWLDLVERDVRANPNALLGPAADVRGLAGRAFLYIEGWCIAAQRPVWDELHGWDAETFQRPYWEDVDLCWRAVNAGFRLRRRPWPVRHISNVTSDSVPGSKDATAANREVLEARVAAYDAAEGVARI